MKFPREREVCWGDIAPCGTLALLSRSYGPGQDLVAMSTASAGLSMSEVHGA